MGLSKNQQERLNELTAYAIKQRDELGYGYPGYDKEQTDKWTNVLAWIILIEDDQ